MVFGLISDPWDSLGSLILGGRGGGAELCNVPNSKPPLGSRLIGALPPSLSGCLFIRLFLFDEYHSLF